MDSTMAKVAKDFYPMLRVYEDGRIERCMAIDTVPPLDDPDTNAKSKDVLFSQEPSLSARLFLPKATKPGQKLSVLAYFHGGGFCIESAFSPKYRDYLNTLVSEANILAVAVEYRRAPEHILPAAYDDSWAAIKWIASHVNEDGPEDWLNCHADLGKVFFAGDSAGGNIAHCMAMRNGQEKLVGIDGAGLILIHPFFWGKEPIENEALGLEFRTRIDALWQLVNPNTSSGCDDPLLNPFHDPNLPSLGCNKVLVLAAEKDWFRQRAWDYYENLKKSGWTGEVEIMETEEEDHCFHLNKPESEKSLFMLKKICSFLNQSLA